MSPLVFWSRLGWVHRDRRCATAVPLGACSGVGPPQWRRLAPRSAGCTRKEPPSIAPKRPRRTCFLYACPPPRRVGGAPRARRREAARDGSAQPLPARLVPASPQSSTGRRRRQGGRWRAVCARRGTAARDMQLFEMAHGAKITH